MRDKKTVCVQGLGFVGAAMSVAIAHSSRQKQRIEYNVIGIEQSTDRGKKIIDKINKGIFPHESNDESLTEACREAVSQGILQATDNFDAYEQADITIIDLPFNTEEDHPFKTFLQAFDQAASRVPDDSLFIVETTLPPGTCEKKIKPRLREHVRHREGINNIHLAHSYERVMPGKNYLDSIINIWRVYAGISEEASKRCEKFLSSIINVDEFPLTELDSTTASETAKIIENSYRAVNIAFIQEWTEFAESVGIDLYEVIEAIRKRPTHENIMNPGFGVGGYCLPKDPTFGDFSAREIFEEDDLEFPFSLKAVEVNSSMPMHTLDVLQDYFGGDLKNRDILVLGVSYRPDVSDVRNSPVKTFALNAKKYGANLSFHDPIVKEWGFPNTKVQNSIPLADDFEAIVFTQQHEEYRQLNLREWLRDYHSLLVDANNVLLYEQLDRVRSLKSDLSIYRIGEGEIQ